MPYQFTNTVIHNTLPILGKQQKPETHYTGTILLARPPTNYNTLLTIAQITIYAQHNT
jgi:hypothetical protein